MLKSAVFHYEFEFIHPFSDGNDRMGRMWHTFLLGNWIPIEEIIQSRQKEYYDALNKADQVADSTVLVYFMLEIIRDSLKSVTIIGNKTDQVTEQVKSSVSRLLVALGDETLSVVELMKRLGLSHRQTFRKNYLDSALDHHLI